MSHLHDHVLLDLLIHPDQRVDDLEAIARYATAAGHYGILEHIWEISRDIASGATKLKIGKQLAAEICDIATSRSNTIQALVHDNLATIEPRGKTPKASVIQLTDAGRAAITTGTPH